MKNLYYYEYSIGTIGIAEENNAISHVCFGGASKLPSYQRIETPLIKKAATQLEEYFSGERKVFDLPLAPQGTDFQQTVWKALQTIPAGETRSYIDIAMLIKKPKAARAVGMANNRNPIAIIIPCHRVIGKNGALVGYASGIDNKQYLLDLEKGYA